MQQEQSKLSDETMPGIACEIQIRKQGKYNYKFAKLLDEKFKTLNNGDEVFVLMPSEHEDLLQQCNVDNDFDKEKFQEDFMARIREQAKIIQDLTQTNEIITIEKEKLEKKLENSADASEIKDLQEQNCILSDANKKLKHAHKQQNKTIKSNNATIKDLEQTIAELKEVNDNLSKQLEDSIDASEIEDLQNTIQDLKEKHDTSENKRQKLKQSYESLVESSDALANKNESLIAENNDLKNTNKFLNENIVGLKASFDKTLEDKTNDAKELKETIEKQQSHIDELTDKYHSLLPSKENIPQKQHYIEIGALKDEIKDKEKEINKLNGEIETKLESQKSDLLIEHANEKAQMLVAYNQELNKLKLDYNNLAKDYNYLLNGVDSLTRINTFFNGKHNEIKKDKEQVPLLEISEHLPPSDETTIEYVPKD